MTRIGRKIIAGLGVAALLFAQLAVAAYACPISGEGKDATAEVMAPAAAQPCNNMDEERVNLCKQHCEVSFQIDTSFHAALAVPVLPLLAIIAQHDLHLPSKANLQVTLLAGLAAPPPSLRFCVLRI